MKVVANVLIVNENVTSGMELSSEITKADRRPQAVHGFRGSKTSMRIGIVLELTQLLLVQPTRLHISNRKEKAAARSSYRSAVQPRPSL